MKNNTILFFFLFISISIVNAQINKPKVSVNTKQVPTGISLQGLKVNNLENFKNLADLKKLNIPVQQTTEELLNKKPASSWKISPNQLYNAQLKLDYFRGTLKNNIFYLRGKNYIDNEPRRIENTRAQGFGLSDELSYNFPLGIKFRTSGSNEYILKLRVEDASRKDIFIVKNDTFIYRISPNGSEYNYVFTSQKSEDITLKFSSSIYNSRTSSEDIWSTLPVKEIVINKLSN